MADAAASKAVVGNHMRVQLPPLALIPQSILRIIRS
jgi:hypothetical protein